MARTIYDSTQILNEIVEGKHIAGPTKSFYVYDDMFYVANPTSMYNAEGTFSTLGIRGGGIRYASGIVAGNRARLNQDEALVPMDPLKELIMRLRIGTIILTQGRYFEGFFGALPTAVEPSVEPANGLYFRRIDGAAVANWFAVARKANVETAVNTGIVGDAAFHNFEIILIDSLAVFTIDGVIKASITTNLPIVALSWGSVVVTREAAAKDIDIDTLILYNKR